MAKSGLVINIIIIKQTFAMCTVKRRLKRCIQSAYTTQPDIIITPPVCQMTTSHAGLLQDYIFVVASVEADLWFTVSDALLPLVCLVSQAYTLKIYKKMFS